MRETWHVGRQTRSVAVHILTRELFVVSGAAYGKTSALPSKHDKPQWIEIGWTEGEFILGDEVAAVWIQQVQLWLVSCSVSRSAVLLVDEITRYQRQVHQFWQQFFHVVCCVHLHLLTDKVQLPFPLTHMPADTMRGKCLLFNQQSMRVNVSFAFTSPHTIIRVTDGWIQISYFRRREDMLGFTFP